MNKNTIKELETALEEAAFAIDLANRLLKLNGNYFKRATFQGTPILPLPTKNVYYDNLIKEDNTWIEKMADEKDSKKG